MTKANNLDDLLKVSDYITVHVPYIKVRSRGRGWRGCTDGGGGAPISPHSPPLAFLSPPFLSQGATHHMLNADNMKLCKPNVHLLNFARGESRVERVFLRATCTLIHLTSIMRAVIPSPRHSSPPAIHSLPSLPYSSQARSLMARQSRTCGRMAPSPESM